jgi:hypothetical protein
MSTKTINTITGYIMLTLACCVVLVFSAIASLWVHSKLHPGSGGFLPLMRTDPDAGPSASRGPLSRGSVGVLDVAPRRHAGRAERTPPVTFRGLVAAHVATHAPSSPLVHDDPHEAGDSDHHAAHRTTDRYD